MKIIINSDNILPALEELKTLAEYNPVIPDDLTIKKRFPQFREIELQILLELLKTRFQCSTIKSYQVFLISMITNLKYHNEVQL